MELFYQLRCSSTTLSLCTARSSCASTIEKEAASSSKRLPSFAHAAHRRAISPASARHTLPRALPRSMGSSANSASCRRVCNSSLEPPVAGRPRSASRGARVSTSASAGLKPEAQARRQRRSWAGARGAVTR
eukprot:scaffold15316_cov69-Phaeocystis_antarctica.AAC.11